MTDTLLMNKRKALHQVTPGLAHKRFLGKGPRFTKWLTDSEPLSTKTDFPHIKPHIAQANKATIMRDTEFELTFKCAALLGRPWLKPGANALLIKLTPRLTHKKFLGKGRRFKNRLTDSKPLRKTSEIPPNKPPLTQAHRATIMRDTKLDTFKRAARLERPW